MRIQGEPRFAARKLRSPDSGAGEVRGARFALLRPTSVEMNLKNLSPVRRRALTPIQSFFRSVAEKGRFLRPVIKAEHKHRLFAFFMLGVLFTAFLFLFFHTISSRMQSVSQVSALTEKVEFQVTQPGLAAIPLRQMRLATSDQSLDGKCIEGLIVPALGANVIYGRTGYGPLSIQILPPKTDPQSTIAGKFEPSDNSRALALNGNIYIESDPACSQVLAGIPSSAVTPYHSPSDANLGEGEDWL